MMIIQLGRLYLKISTICAAGVLCVPPYRTYTIPCPNAAYHHYLIVFGHTGVINVSFMIFLFIFLSLSAAVRWPVILLGGWARRATEVHLSGDSVDEADRQEILCAFCCRVQFYSATDSIQNARVIIPRPKYSSELI